MTPTIRDLLAFLESEIAERQGVMHAHSNAVTPSDWEHADWEIRAGDFGFLDALGRVKAWAERQREKAAFHESCGLPFAEHDNRDPAAVLPFGCPAGER